MTARQLMLPANRAFNSNGLGVPGAVAKLYTTGTLTPQNFYADLALSTSLGPTITANGAGRFPNAYGDDSTPYRLRVEDAHGVELDDMDPFYFGTALAVNLANGATVATRSALAAVAGLSNQSAILAESGREGTFVFSTADLSAEVAADTLQGIYVAPSSDTTGASGAWVRVFDAFTPEMFGAAGDGTTDDYAALTALAAAVTMFGSGRVVFGRGKTYYVGQYMTASNGVVPIEFENCNGLTIDLNGSKIDFKGDFDRDASTTTGIGVQITACTKVIVQNGELDGNVEQTTNTSNSTENNNAVGLNVRSCDDVLIQNLYAHHFATDDIAFREGGAEVSPGVNRACKRVTVLNSRFEYAGRCAFSPIGVRGLYVENCSLSYTAQFTGDYDTGGHVGHAPRCAFDIEPTSDASVTGDQDVDTGEITIRRCRFIDNYGGDWRSNANAKADTLTIEGNRLESYSGSSGNPSINLGMARMVIRDNYIDTKANFFTITTGIGTSDCIIEGNEIRGSSAELFDSSADTARLLLRDNRIIHTGTAAISGAVVNVKNKAAVVENNYFYFPKEIYTDGGAGDFHKVISVGDGIRFSNNRYETNLLAASGSGGTAHFCINMVPTATNPPVFIDERFTGVSPGTADTFRPESGSTFDTTKPWSKNRPGYPGVPGKQSLTDAAFTYQNGRDPNHLELAAPLTANRTITLSSTDAKEGAEVRVTRTAASTGAFTLTVAAKALSTGQWAIARYSGGAWTLIATGSL